MKLFEDLEEMGGTISDAISKIIKEVYGQTISDGQLEQIVSGLSLRNLLDLDQAYTNQDISAIKDIIGPLPQMEYSMGVSGRESQASSRPAVTTATKSQSQTATGKNDDGPGNGSYSTGSQNAVTTQKINVTGVNHNDTENQQDGQEEDEPIKESDSINVVNMIDWLQRRAGIHK
jgi:hypothetical protein